MKKRNPKPKVHKAVDDDIEEWMIGQPTAKDDGAKKRARIRKGNAAATEAESYRD